ncbi:hypothetical protein GYN24_00730 [Lactococcus piscium]|uniref:hypothetical protein n=1 Tax=Pseudolactococcus paracarnosus TaxID=2749962 RepID=UPI000D45A585|nr:hypothetical protein [Lactococcus paracarnosus]MCJ1993112.1 hypothetical protein [Lactococcus paracarnosus]SPC38105.1 conserved exported hypothetical protein [Lactococcus piscium]
MKHKKLILSLVLILCIFSGITVGFIHQKQVKDDRMAQEKLDKQRKMLKQAATAVDTAYQARSDKDVAYAETAVSKLSSHQKADKRQLIKKLTQLKSYLKQISDVSIALSKATQSKTEEDIKATQALIDMGTSDYLKADKTDAQNKLSTLIAQIAKEKAETEAKTKAEAQAKQVASEALQQPSNAVQAPSVETYSPAPQQPYQAPTQSAGGNSYIPPAPSATPSPAPAPTSPPSSASRTAGSSVTTGNASGTTNSPGGWDSPNNAGMGEWRP